MPHLLDAFAAEPAAARAPLVALVVEGIDWHARMLAQAFAALGVRTRPVDLRACAIETQRSGGLAIDGMEDCLPEAVLVRTMSGGTFQAVTMRLGILHALRENGVLVWNDARAIERCVDKSMTSFLLAHAGIPTPATWAVESPDAARAIVRRETARGPLVLKPLFGSQGRGLKLLRSEDDLPNPDAVAGVYYLQRYVGVEGAHSFRDFRLLVSQGHIVAGMARQATSWITNLKQGGRPMAIVAGSELKDLAIHACEAVGANFAGVDILYDDSHPTVLEVNSMPAWSGLQKVTHARIADILASDLIATLATRARRGATV
jgi:tetrahydromethanopterin:alpha-L-glutamate ligase